MPVTRILAPLAALLIAGCTVPLATGSSDWRAVAADNDRDRLRDWRKTFERALEMAAAAGHADEVAAEGALLQPDAALGGGIPSGSYRCRWIKLGARSEGARDFQRYGPFPCTVSTSRNVQAFAFGSGAQRPAGIFYPSDRVRLVFLGALSLGDEAATMSYGTDADRDMAGWVERVGDARWRIILPEPRLESVLDIIELTPAG